MQIKSALKRLILSTGRTSNRRYQGAVLAYHRVTEDEPDPNNPLSVLAVSRQRFIRHMRLISTRCRVVPLHQILHASASWDRRTPPPIAVTFDDGYRDNITVALPILRQFQVPATIFICTGLSSGRIVPWWYELWRHIASAHHVTGIWRKIPIDLQCVTNQQRKRAFLRLHATMRRLTVPEQQRFLDAIFPSRTPSESDDILSLQELTSLTTEPLISVAAHSDSHLVCRLASDEELSLDIDRCVLELSRTPGFSREHFAFPYGSREDADVREAEIVHRVFETSWTSRYGLLTSHDIQRRTLLPRVVIERDDDALQLEWKLRALW